MRIMFICTSNTCRSAMAHKILEKRAKEENKNIEVYSCGIFADPADGATNEAIEVMKEYNIDLKPHRSTNIKKSNIEDMDIILCATVGHKNSIINMYPELKEKIFTIREYADFDQNDLDIRDPWGWGIETYRRCVAQIDECIEKIISAGKL